MSAIPDEFLQRTAELSSASTRPLDGSRKVYVQGSRPDIRVPMREIDLDDTPASFGAEKNPPVPSMTPRVPTPILTSKSICSRGSVMSERPGSTNATIPSGSMARLRSTAVSARMTRNWRTCASSICASRAVPKPAVMCRKCITPERALLRRKWNTSPSARA
jgi:hypothetical protein